MITDLIDYLKNKKILILGFGREGQSTYKFIRKHLPDTFLFIADQKKDFDKQHKFLLKDYNIQIISGDNYLDDLENYDIIIKSPGISFKNIDTNKFIDKITSELELFLEFSNIYTIGITGTKGKSTTSSLIYKVLSNQNINTMLLGNIGVPIFDYIDTFTEDMTLVLELSSHQLEFIKKSPNISILLNIFEEHLDHYNSLEDYIEAKLNIFKFQKNSDHFIYNINNALLTNALKKHSICSNIHEVSCIDDAYSNITSNSFYIKDDKIYFKNTVLYDCTNKRKLLGNHNLNNIMFVLSVSEILNLNLNKTIETINHFKPLPHRLEYVGKFHNIKYYNDAIATIPEATINSINTLKDVNTLIIGGMDRGINFSKFIKFLNTGIVENIICMPYTGHIIGKELTNPNITVNFVQDLEEAVNVAKKITRVNRICLLSPASASYGFFTNFMEKGNMFKKLVKLNKEIY